MPSRDSTGRPLSGAAKRRRARERAGPPAAAKVVEVPTLGAPSGLESTPPPPTDRNAVLVWAQALQARCAVLADESDHADRARLVGQVLAQVGKLKGAAADAADAAANLQHYLHQTVDVAGAEPPQGEWAPVAIPLWAFLRLADLAHRVATADPMPDEGGALARAKALAQVGLLHPQAEYDRLGALLEKAAEG